MIKFFEKKSLKRIYSIFFNIQALRWNKQAVLCLAVSGFIFIMNADIFSQTPGPVETADRTQTERVKTADTEKTVTAKPDTEKKPVNREPEAAAEPVKQKETVRKEQETSVKAVKKKTPPEINYGLLSVKDGNYKYKRIPGIKLPEEKTSEIKENDFDETEDVVLNSDLETQIDTVTGEKEQTGIFGLKKKTVDLIVILILIVIIIGIIIFLKIKSKERGDSVLRRFPGA